MFMPSTRCGDMSIKHVFLNMMPWHVYSIDIWCLYVDEIGFYKHMNWNPEAPYNDLPKLPPDLQQMETRNVLKMCINARAAIVEVKSAGAFIPVQSLLINILSVLDETDY